VARGTLKLISCLFPFRIKPFTQATDSSVMGIHAEHVASLRKVRFFMQPGCFKRYALSFLVLLAFPFPVLAMPTISVSFLGNETFLFSSRELKDVGKIEVTVTYNPSSLANPRVIPQSTFAGAVVSSDGASGSTARMIVTSPEPMTGSGRFATLVFDPVGTSFGTIRSVNGRVYDSNGKAMSALFEFTNPTPPLDPNDPDNQSMVEERERKGESFMGGGVPYVPKEAVVMEEGGERSKQAPQEKENNADTTGEGPDGGKSPKHGSTTVQSVLERFRLFDGERNPKNLTALFDADSAASYSQTPAILLADGKETVRVTITGITPGKTPSFSFRSARYVSVLKLSDTLWLVEAKPKEGVLEAAITLFDNGRMREIPLTVSPKVQVDLIKAGKVGEADFALFLKKLGTAHAPLYDMNGDGKRDYLDDYIFTANYLVALGKKAGKKPAVPQTAEGKGGAEAGRLKKN
jgi:hypothetical protein